MELGQIKDGKYGKYYEYTLDGKKTILGLEDKRPEDSSLLGITLETAEQVNELINKGQIDFKLKDELITAKLVPYVNKKGETVQIIKYSKPYSEDTTTYSDITKIVEQKEAIIAIFSDNSDTYDNYYAKIKTNDYLKSIGLGKYHCSTQPTELSTVVKVIIYFGKKSDVNKTENQVFTMYLESTTRSGYKVARIEISHSDYLEKLNEYREKSRIAEEQRATEQKLLEDSRTEGRKWLQELNDKIWNGNKSLSYAQAVEALAPIVSSVPSDPAAASKKPLTTINDVIDITKADYIGQYFYSYSSKRTKDLQDMKNSVMKSLRHIYDYYKLLVVRITIRDEANSLGIESVVGDIDSSSILDSLDLGEFKKLQKALVGSSRPISYICMNMYDDIIDPDKLKISILRMLKIYYDFNDFPTKDIKAIAKFVAVHDIKEYQETMLEYNEAIEVMLDEGKPAVKKRVLESISGGKRGKSFDISFLKAKSYYFERTARLKDDSKDVTHVLDELRSLIDEFNTSSDVAILVNIELNSDESFVYQFYTFADSSSKDKIDGRRVQHMTKLYNRGRPDNKKIYFDYENK